MTQSTQDKKWVKNPLIFLFYFGQNKIALIF
jgi:hypothetical protein